MKKLKIFFYWIVLTTSIFAQKSAFIYKYSYCSNFLQYLDENRVVSISFSRYCAKLPDGNWSDNICKRIQSIVIFSTKDGTKIKEIGLASKDFIYPIHDFILNKLNETITLIAVDYRSNEDGNDKYFLHTISLKDNSQIWTTVIYSESSFLRIQYDKSYNNIICVFNSGIKTISAIDGSIIKESNKIESIINSEAKYPRYAISKNGKYFAWWEAKYLTWSVGDESVIKTLADLTWYGIKWLFCFGSIPQSVKVWDIGNDVEYAEISIPYEADKGTPVFSNDEEEILLGPFETEYSVYPLIKEKKKREFIQKESEYDFPESHERSSINSSDYKVISNNKKIFAARFGSSKLFVINYENGKLLKQFEKSPDILASTDKYAMDFSPDSKYFTVVTEGNKLEMYDTETWEMLWQTEYKPEQEEIK